MVFQHHPPLQAIDAVAEAGDNLNGFCHEPVSPDPADKGLQFDTMLKQGVPYKGIDLACAPTSGFGYYGDFDTRGLRYITLDEDGTYETEMVYYYAKFCNDKLTKARFTMCSAELSDEEKIRASEEYIAECKKNGTYSSKIKKECKIALD